MFLKYLTGQLYEGEGTGSVTPPPTPVPPSGAEHPVAAPWVSIDNAWKIGEGDKAVDWWDTIPEEKVREHVKAKGYKNPAQLAMGNYNLTQLQTGTAKDVITLPPEGAKPEEIDAFYTKLGRPESKDKYELKMPDGVTPDPQFVEFGKDIAFKLGLNPKQAQMLADEWNGFAGKTNEGAITQQQEANAQALAALQTKWGADLEANKAAGLRVMQSLGLPDATVSAIEGSIGSAALVELLAMIGRKSDEGKFVSGGGSSVDNPSTMTQAQAQSTITALQGDETFLAKYRDAKHPEHKASVDRMLALQERASRA